MIFFEKAHDKDGLKPGLLIVCLCYFFIQLIYITHLPLMHDEFQQAYSSFEVLKRTPYVDYKPYKTVLGYYLQAIVLKVGLEFFRGDNWQALIFLKVFIAFINASMLYIIGALVARIFVYKAVLVSMICFCLFSNILEHGIAIRLDMITAWLGFFGLALAINRYYISAGLITGLSFLFSQKGIYYSVSLIFSVGATLFIHKEISRKNYLLMVSLITACLLPAMLYYFYWFLAGANLNSTNSIVSGSLVAYAREKIYFLEPYWQQMFERNIGSLILGTGGLGVLILDRINDRGMQKNSLLLMYALVMTLMVFMDRNTWPYFFVLYIPLIIFVVPRLYESIVLSKKKFLIIFFSGCLALVFFQWIQRISIIVSKSNRYQHEMVYLMQELLKSDNRTESSRTYIAGFHVLLEAKHAESKYFGWLDKQGYIRLLTTDPEIILASLQKNPPLVILRSIKTHFPDAIDKYFSLHYRQFCGSIQTYMFLQEKNSAFLSAPFNGYYRIFYKSGFRDRDDNLVKDEDRYFYAGEKIYGTDLALQYSGSGKKLSNNEACNERDFLEDNYEF